MKQRRRAYPHILETHDTNEVLNVVKAGYGTFLSFFKENPFSFFVLVDKDDLFSSFLMCILNI